MTEPAKELKQYQDAPSLVPAVTPTTMLDRAIQAGVTPEVLEKLIALKERWDANEARKAFDNAMSAAKAKIPVIRKNRKVGFENKRSDGRTDYAHEDMAEIARTVDPILAEEGLSYRYRTVAAPGQPVGVTCIITHRLGHNEETTLVAPHDATGNKNPIQAIGSTVTYLQRYTLKAALGLAAAADDDGQAAGQGETITDAQVKALQKLIDEIGGAKAEGLKAAFLKKFKIEALADLPQTLLEDATDALNAKRRAA